MYCESCGQEIDKKAKFCPECGAPVKEQQSKSKKKKEKVKKPFYKRWWFWTFIIFVIIGASGGDEGTEEIAETIPESTVSSLSASHATLSEAIASMQTAVADIEESTSARVDEISRIAKNDAINISEKIGNEACEYIIEKYPNFHTDNVTMENLMYCGFLLEYGYNGETVSKLGQDVTQAIKYVYRGAESVEDDLTQENLRQVEKILIEAGLLNPESTEQAASNSTESNNASIGEKNALRSALNYLNYTAFSYTGLIDQLKYEGYTTEEATYAVDNCGADWFEQALLCAKNYLEYSAFSYSGLIDQLKYEGFSVEESTYGADNCGADWFEQAAKCAQNYLDYSAFSRTGLIDQLKFEGFTNEQAVYGVDQTGI